MRATRHSDDYRGPEKTDRPEWAGMSMETWIDLEVLDESPVFEIMKVLCEKFPQRSRQQHIELIATRLTERGRKDEIGFYLVNGQLTKDLKIADALAQLRLPRTWNVNRDEHLVVWQKPGFRHWWRKNLSHALGVTLGPSFMKLWSRLARERGD